jgi:hypothetical protein
MTNSSSNQQTAAIAVRQAAIDMVGTYGFTCGDVATITEEFRQAVIHFLLISVQLCCFGCF